MDAASASETVPARSYAETFRFFRNASSVFTAAAPALMVSRSDWMTR